MIEFWSTSHSATGGAELIPASMWLHQAEKEAVTLKAASSCSGFGEILVVCLTHDARVAHSILELGIAFTRCRS